MLTDILALGLTAEDKAPVRKPLDALFRRHNGLLFYM
jgi:hypothetical protein